MTILKLNGTITDGKGRVVPFTEKDIVKIEVEFGEKNLFYEINDEFNKLKKMKEKLEWIVNQELVGWSSPRVLIDTIKREVLDKNKS